MKSQPRDHSDLFGRLIFTFLLILLLSVFSDISAGQNINPDKVEFTAAIHLNNTHATIAGTISVPVFEKTWISILNSRHILLEDQLLRLRAGNIKTEQLICNLQKTQLRIKPVLFCLFYHPIDPEDQGEPPSLS